MPNPPDNRDDAEPKSDVGYCKPPKDSQFGPESGNPRGRPPGSKNRKTIVKEVASEMHQIEEGNKQVWRSTFELVLLSIRNLSLEGSNKAFRFYHKLLTKYEPQEIENSGGYLVAPETLTSEEWIAKAEADNMKKIKPK